MAYEQLAAVYDILMEDIDYEQWAAYVDRLLKKFHCPGKRMLDLGCGTGNITIPLAQKGFRITAIDLSAEMLGQAKRKSEVLQLPIDWQLQDMANLQLTEANGADPLFDAAIATFDAFNYLTEAEDLQHLLQTLDFLLADNGLLVFDLQTPYKLREYLGNQIFTLHHPQVEYMWENHFDEDEQICQMDITFFVKQENGLYQRVTESHREKVYEFDLLEMWLNLNGFKVLAIYQELAETDVQQNDHRAVFVARHLSLEEQETLLDEEYDTNDVEWNEDTMLF